MDIQYYDTCALLGVGSKWIAGALVAAGNQFVVTNLDGTVLSIQPDGSQQTRVAGTAGPWEVCTVDPSINILHYNVNGIPYDLVYRGR